MKIICKTTLLPFVGTRIRIRLDDPASLTWGMAELSLGSLHDKADIDWGDGSRTVVTSDGSVTHTYAAPGEYEVRISDDISMLGCSCSTGTSPFHTVYAPMIREFHTTATLLEDLQELCFYGAVNLSVFHCEGSALCVLPLRSFGNCLSLVGRLDLPRVWDIDHRAFEGCVGITELHFSAADEEEIKSSYGWEKSGGKFGAPNATSFFDL